MTLGPVLWYNGLKPLHGTTAFHEEVLAHVWLLYF